MLSSSIANNLFYSSFVISRSNLKQYWNMIDSLYRHYFSKVLEGSNSNIEIQIQYNLTFGLQNILFPHSLKPNSDETPGSLPQAGLLTTPRSSCSAPAVHCCTARCRDIPLQLYNDHYVPMGANAIKMYNS